MVKQVNTKDLKSFGQQMTLRVRFPLSLQMYQNEYTILQTKLSKNLRVENVTVLMDTYKANAGAKRNDIMNDIM